MSDIFDRISPDKILNGVVKAVEQKKDQPNVVKLDFSDSFVSLIKELVPLFKQQSMPPPSLPEPKQEQKKEDKQVLNLMKEIEALKISIKKEPIKVEPKPDLEKEKLKAQIEDLKNQLEGIRQTLPLMGGSGVIGIPNPEGNNSKVLTVVKNQATWQTAASGSVSSDAYTTSNVTTTRTLDPTTSTIDNLYNVVASLIVSLQGAGIIQ